MNVLKEKIVVEFEDSRTMPIGEWVKSTSNTTAKITWVKSRDFIRKGMEFQVRCLKALKYQIERIKK